MRRTIAILACCLLLCPACVLSQNPFAYIKLEHWDTHKGMTNDFILNIAQTRDGYIWMTGYSGLTRFDGVHFTTFNSQNEPLFRTDGITSIITETEDSTLWIPTQSSGLIAYKNGRFTRYLDEFKTLFFLGMTERKEMIISRRGYSGILLFNPVTKKYVQKSFADFPKLVKWPPSEWQRNMRAPDTVIASMQNKVSVNIRGTIKMLGIKEGLDSSIGIANQSAFRDSEGRIWLCTERGLYRWNGQVMEPVTGMKGLNISPSNPTSALIAEDKEKGIWVVTHKGLAYKPGHSEHFYYYPEIESAKLQTVNNIVCDREGNLWMASDRGLYKLSKTKMVTYAEREGLKNNKAVAACELSPGRFMVASPDKLYMLDHGILKPYPLKNPRIYDPTHDVICITKDSRNTVWVCCHKSIYRIDANGEKRYDLDNDARYAVEGADGRMYFGIAFKGICFINDHDKPEFLSLPQIDFRSIYLSSIRIPKSGGWIVTSYSNGIHFAGAKGSRLHIDSIGQVASVAVFNSYEESDGTIWFSTANGIMRYRNGKAATIGFASGMPEVSVFQLLPDPLGYYWFPCNKGLLRAKKTELNDYLDGKRTAINWELYDEADGMLNRQCVGARHSIITSDQRLIVPTFGGLVEIDPLHLWKNEHPPLLSINKLDIDNKPQFIDQPVAVDPGSHRYIIGYSALSFVAPEKVKIRFRLLNYDKDWINSVGERKAFYTNLPAGDYTFEVTAANNDGVWAPKPAVLHFTVKAFFYETWWFRALLVIAFVMLVWLFINWRTQTARRRNAWLEKEVAARTADLKASNAALNTQKEELEETLVRLKATQTQLIHSEKMASLGELTAGIAHEIQNPLNFVNNFSEINADLIEDLKTELVHNNTAEAMELADNIKENEQKISYHGKRADGIVKGMLMHSRSGSGEKELTDVNALCDEYLRLSYHGLRARDKSFNAKTESRFDDSLPRIQVNSQEIGRVVLNLLNNAFYAVNERSKLGIPGYQPTVTIETKRLDPYAQIRINDNGPGIPDEVVNKIFQPFFTTKPTGEGTGLGLSLSFDIITKGHGGTLAVETTPGEGTSFIINLPLTRS